jgi:hypothetical protein
MNLISANRIDAPHHNALPSAISAIAARPACTYVPRHFEKPP